MSAPLLRQRIGLARPLRDALVEVWHELPRVAVAGAILGAAFAPLTIALLSGASALVPAAAVPAAAGASGFAQAIAPIGRGERVRLRRLGSVDVVWTCLAITAIAMGVLATGALAPIGAVVVATAGIVLPLGAVYGALRGRRGLAVVHGALVIAAVRPSVALSILGVGVLGAFVVVATAGVLVLVVPAVWIVYASLLVGRTVALVNGEDG